MTKDDVIAEIRNRIRRHEDRSRQLAERAESGYLSPAESALFFSVAANHAGQVVAFNECIKLVEEIKSE